jgi:hypothetical protein
MGDHACPGCPELLKEIAELKARVAELTWELDDAVRAGRRQAAPFRKRPPKPDPKPGRKPCDAHGRPSLPPEQIAERHEAHLPRRLVDVSINVVSKLLVDVDTACAAIPTRFWSSPSVVRPRK